MFGKTSAFAGTLLVAAALSFVTPGIAQGQYTVYRGYPASFPASHRGYRYYGSARYYSPTNSYYPSYNNYAYPGSYYSPNYSTPGYYNDTNRDYSYASPRYSYASPRYRYSWTGSGPYIYYP